MGGGGGGRLFEVGRLLTFSAFRIGANSRVGAYSNKYGNLKSLHHGSCDQTELKKNGTRKNTIDSSNGSQLKFWQIFAKKRAFKKKFIAREQINMSFPFAAYIKCQAKQF